MEFRRRYGTRTLVLVITGISIAVSLACLAAAHLLFPHSADIGDVIVATVVPAVVAPVGSATTLRLVAALDNAYGELSKLASTDPVTGLSTRRSFFEVAEALVEQAPDRAFLVAAMIDLDLFKAVNDTWGHAVGDRALAAVAQRLATAAPDGAALGRLGGDEFACVVLTDERSAEPLCHQLAQPLADIVVAEGVSIGVSVGFAWLPATSGVDAVLAAADGDLYRAKAARKRRSTDR